MTFKIIIQQMPISAEFEVGSLSEAVGILQEQESEIRKLGQIADDLNGTPEAPEATNAAPSGTEPPKRRGRPKGSGADPATATAPAPLPIPGAAPPPPAPAADMTSADGGIPPGLRRDPATNTAPAMVAPPAPPPPPPAPAAPPPSGILAGKVIANLDARKAGAADGGESLAAWLAQAGLVVAGSPYDEAIAAIRLMGDDKLTTIAGALQVA